MSKLDLRKTEKEYYKAGSKPTEVELRPYNYLIVEGVGAPEDAHFHNAINSLYGIAYPLKFYYKEKGNDYVVPKMEGQWWVEGEVPFEEQERSAWHWKLMIPQPDFVSEDDFLSVLASAKENGKINEGIEVKFESIHEGRAVQILHLGSYDNEKENIDKILAYIEENELQVNGYHHEIYISDPTKTPVEKLKTILRYPVK